MGMGKEIAIRKHGLVSHVSSPFVPKERPVADTERTLREFPFNKPSMKANQSQAKDITNRVQVKTLLWLP